MPIDLGLLPTAKLDRFIEEHGKLIPPGLEDAARETCEIRQVVAGFRGRLRAREAGTLHHLIEAWYVEMFVPDRCMDHYPEPLERRNPYAAFKLQNPGFSQWYEKLDFLLEEIPARQTVTRFELPLGDVADLVSAVGLQPGGSLARLIIKSPYLTHDENVAVSVMDARLWLCHSPLPVVIGSDVSYADVRNGEPIPDRPSHGLISPQHVSLRARTVGLHWSMQLKPGLQLHHVAPSQLPDQDSYWAQMARLRYPHFTVRGQSFDSLLSRLATSGKMEDSVLGNLEDWKSMETWSTYTLLAKFVHRMTPGMHQELKRKLEAEEAEED